MQNKIKLISRVITLFIAGISAIPAVNGTEVAVPDQLRSGEEYARLGLEAFQKNELSISHDLFIFAVYEDPINMRNLEQVVEVTGAIVTTMRAQNRFTEALESISKSQNLLDTVKVHFLEFHPQGLIPLKNLERHLSGLKTELNSHINRNALSSIGLAMKRAQKARRFYWFNDRTEVIQGLREILWLIDYFDQLTPDVRGEYHSAMAALKERVSNKEWESLLAQAGYIERAR